MKSRLKIAVWHNLPSGGGKRALHDQVAGLVARGHTVEAWRPDSAADFLPLDQLIPEHVVPLPAGTRLPGTTPASRWPGVRFLRDAQAARRLAEAMRAHARACAAEIRAGGFTVLLAHPCRFFYAPHIGRYASPPKVLYLQEPLRHLYEAMPTLDWLSLPATNDEGTSWLSRFTNTFKAQVRFSRLRAHASEEQTNARAFNQILANSYYSAESIQRAYGLSPQVCYLGLDERLFRWLDLPREPFVIGLGSLDWIKGTDLAVEVVAHLPEPRPKLVWVCNSANPDYRRTVEKQAHRSGVDLDIRQAIPDAEVVELLNRASVMLYTSRLEPFGYAPLEANLCGTPVVAVMEGGIRETIRDGVNGYTAPRDPVALAAALHRLLADPDLARRLGQQGRDHVREQWSVQKSARELESHLIRVVGGSDAVR